jgi:hypothetical protein
MKKCIKCIKQKNNNDFIISVRGKPGISKSCIDCRRKYSLEYFHKHKQERKSCRLKSKNKIRNNNIAYITNYLATHPCIDCGETDILVLEFDHIRDKKYGIGNMTSNYGIETVKTEIAKCEVRCANCHRRKHSKERRFKNLS